MTMMMMMMDLSVVDTRHVALERIDGVINGEH